VGSGAKPPEAGEKITPEMLGIQFWH